MSPARFSRREWLQGVLGAGGALALGGCATWPDRSSAAPASDAPPDLVRRENQRPGTRDWMLTRTGTDPATKYRCPWIEGYCSHTSIRGGDTLTFHVSTNPPASFTLDLYRLGHYGGAGGRLMTQLGPFQGITQPDPPIGPKRLRDCQWEPCTSFQVPADWLSGVYVGKLTTQPTTLAELRHFHRPG